MGFSASPKVQTGVPTLSAGSDETFDRVEYAYNRAAEQKSLKDQNETVHDYLFDGLGRMTLDDITAGAGVDATVDKIAYDYEVRGMVERITSKNAAGTALDEVFREYNAFGLLTKEYQDHDSTVDEYSPRVEYTYADGSDNHVRLDSIIYPDGRELTYNYSSDSGCPDDALGRVTSIVDDDDTVLAEYTYLGWNTLLAVEYSEPGIVYDLAHQTSGQYDRIDQFGRVTDALWKTSTADLVHLKYGYDAAGNRLWRQDEAAAGSSQNLDERYWYDGLNQLVDAQRGNLDFTDPDDPTIAALSRNFAQQWDLDATGNWSNFQEDTDGNGTPNLDQAREHNAANEMTSADTWGSPAYDRAGNMLSVPDPYDLDSVLTCTYDAWNRLVKVERGETEVATYRYDGLNRRIVKTTPTQTRHYYLSASNQVLEERVGSDGFANVQNVWGLRYVDDLVLRDRDISETRDGTLEQRHYALQDANFNVVAIAEADGDVAERYTYTAYGKCEVRVPDFSLDANNESDYSWTSLYTAREFDAETGLYYYRARYYDVDMGRFIGRDFIGYAAADANLYRYCGNNPADGLDPSGEARIGQKHGGCEMIFNPAGKHASGVDVHPAGGDLWAHAHIEQDGKLITRVDKNGNPLPGQPALTPGARKVVEKYKTELNKALTTAEKRLAAWKQQQEVARSTGKRGGKLGKM